MTESSKLKTLFELKTKTTANRNSKEYKEQYLKYLEEQVHDLYSYTVTPVIDIIKSAKAGNKRSAGTLTIPATNELIENVMKMMLGKEHKLEALALLWKIKKQ